MRDRSEHLSLIFLALLAGTGCAFSVDLEGKACPCVEGYVCNVSTNVCVRPGADTGEPNRDAAADAGDPDAEPVDAEPVDAGGADADSFDAEPLDGEPSDAVPADTGNTFTLIDDEFIGEFDQGTFEDTTWAADRLTLEPGIDSGTFISRRFEPGGTPAWSAIAWEPVAPYGKPLPDLGQAESGYVEGSIDMRENVLLLHLDETTATVGATLADTSGLGNDANVAGTPAPSVAGRFGGALDLDASRYARITVGAASPFQFGQADFTWSIWVRTTENCAGNKVHLGVENGGATEPHLWLGCAPQTLAACPAGAVGGRAAGTLRSSRNDAASGVDYCSARVINDGQWHHLALTKQGHATTTVTLYVDGVQEDVAAGGFTAPLTFPADPELAIGAFSRGTYQAAGVFDEVAIFVGRALTVDEVRSLHLRGAARLGLQIRQCSETACTAFIGPGLSPTDYFRDPADALMPGSEIMLGVDSSPALQYRVLMEADGLEVPSLRSVTITGRH